MLTFREMNVEDLVLFKTWLFTPHIAKWYHEPFDWIEEVKQQDHDFKWIHHYIVELEGMPLGFCQYYACEDSEELWEGYTAIGGSYSIDYMIGEVVYLHRGYGKQIITKLITMVKAHVDAKRLVVQPEQENEASCGVLLSCGFIYDATKDIYVKELP